MVRAIIAGSKTQTRRVVNFEQIAKKTGCTKGKLAYSTAFKSWAVFGGNGPADVCLVDCPYGQPGDRLWVRETFARVHPGVLNSLDPDPDSSLWDTVFRADANGGHVGAMTDRTGWKPSIFLPRRLSRITLEVTEVRVERVQAISEEDARVEGVWELPLDPDRFSSRGAFSVLWDSINGKRPGCSWVDNPWVWAISFRRVD